MMQQVSSPFLCGGGSTVLNLAIAKTSDFGSALSHFSFFCPQRWQGPQSGSGIFQRAWPKGRMPGPCRSLRTRHLTIRVEKTLANIRSRRSQESMRLRQAVERNGWISVMNPMIPLVMFEEIIPKRDVGSGP